MADSEKRIIWSDLMGLRFFLIPEKDAPVPGGFQILAMDGTSRDVDEAWAKPFEVTAEQAQQFFKGK